MRNISVQYCNAERIGPVLQYGTYRSSIAMRNVAVQYCNAERIGPVFSNLHETQTFTKYTEFSTQNQIYI
jgi:hypothetical protein